MRHGSLRRIEGVYGSVGAGFGEYTESGGSIMHCEYIEQRNGGYYVAGTRISLDWVVYAFKRGDPPERILEEFPLLDKVSRAYGAIQARVPAPRITGRRAPSGT